MPKPPCCRRVRGRPRVSVFKPAGPGGGLEQVQLSLDEFEAIRLADQEGLYQAEAAGQMEVSRATFGRILEAAHRKVAEALVGGKALVIVGGPVSVEAHKPFWCPRCAQAVERRSDCPKCEKNKRSGCSTGRIQKEEQR